MKEKLTANRLIAPHYIHIYLPRYSYIYKVRGEKSIRSGKIINAKKCLHMWLVNGWGMNATRSQDRVRKTYNIYFIYVSITLYDEKAVL